MANQKVLALGPSNRQAIYKANSGGMRFKMRTSGLTPELALIAYRDPVICVYKLTFGYETKVKVKSNMVEEREKKFPSGAISNFNEFREYFLTWHSNKIKFGIVGQEALVDYQTLTDPVVCVVFKTACNLHTVEWIIETSPVLLKSIPFKKLSGKLHWRTMRNGKLPPDAMIGGFENELIYIARADHSSSLCPGKYVPSTGKAYVPWGHLEYEKEEFEILCGINGQWIKTKSNYIPQNAFIGGYSEVNNEPLYIGRAMIEGRLICGKVHLLYKTCYLPFQGNEVEKSVYEILVIPGTEIPQGIPLQDTTLQM